MGVQASAGRNGFRPAAILAIGSLLVLLGLPVSGQSTTPVSRKAKVQTSDLSNAQIIRMLKAGIPETVILEKIQTSTAKLDSSTDALIALKTAGASEAVLNEILKHSGSNSSPAIANKVSWDDLPSESLERLCKRGTSGDSNALHELMRRFITAPTGQIDLGCAGKGFRQLAERGDAIAQAGLGYIYMLQPNQSEAVRWFRLSAAQGNAYGEAALGVMYWFGLGVQRDDVEGLRWYSKAADQGNADDQLRLGLRYETGSGVPKDYKQAAYWVRRSAEQNELEAMYVLGWFYQRGRGVQRDFREAARWYRKAAEVGSAESQVNLGVMYDNGEGVTTDSAEASRWFRKAADRGNVDALRNLGILYDFGRGVPLDHSMAATLYRQAAAKGDEIAIKNLVVQHKLPKTSATSPFFHSASIQPSSTSANFAQSMFVAFSFSTPMVDDFGGDGAWGVAVNTNEQAAIENSGISCAAHSQKPDWCGTGNGGRYPVCQADGKTRWVALAINNDGTEDNWGDGEAIGYETEDAADQAAVVNCNHAGCHVVWSKEVDCGKQEQQGRNANACIQVSVRPYSDTGIPNWALTNACDQKTTVVWSNPSTRCAGCSGPFGRPPKFVIEGHQTRDTQTTTDWQYKVWACFGNLNAIDPSTGSPGTYNSSTTVCK